MHMYMYIYIYMYMPLILKVLDHILRKGGGKLFNNKSWNVAWGQYYVYGLHVW